ncbi:MAG TPA: hypothetical protein VHO90_11260 [Bacteroidales bacterium]|nr:hypothetical protein [Bacteroidales bacterium]
MEKEAVRVTEDYDQVIGSIEKNSHLLNESDDFYKFNNRLLISNSRAFLHAVKEDIGGEIIVDTAIGPFLYFGDETMD